MKTAIILALLATPAAAVVAPDPEPDPAPEPPAAEAPSPEQGGEGLTCEDRIPACTVWTNPAPITDQRYLGTPKGGEF